MYCYHCMEEIPEGNFCQHCMKENVAEEIPYHLRVGSMLKERYLTGNALGENGFGITYAAMDQTAGQRVAVKEFFPSGYVTRNQAESNWVYANSPQNTSVFQQDKERFLQQAQKLGSFSSEPALVAVQDVFEENNTAYMVMEYLEGICLEKYVSVNGPLEPEETFRWMLPVMESLARLHDNGIFHQSVSTSQLMLLIDGSLKLMGFGPSLSGAAAGEDLSSADVRGVCAVLYQCMTGTVPADPQTAVIQKPSELGIEISPSLEKILMYGLSVFPANDSPRMQELIHYINQAFRGEPVLLPEPPAPEPVIPQETEKTDISQGFVPAPVPEPVQNVPAEPPVPAQPEPPASEPEQHMVPSPQPEPEPETYPNPPAQPEFYTEPGKKSKKKVLLGIFIPLGVLILAAAAGAIYWFLIRDPYSYGSQQLDDSLSSSQVGWSYESTPDESEVSNMLNTVRMISCIGEYCEDAQERLEQRGLTVEIKRVFHDEIAPEYVISQNIEEGETVGKGSTVILTVSKGRDESPEGYNQKLVLSAPAGSSTGVLTLYEWSNETWKTVTSCPATLGALGISSDYGEGRNATPLGTFKLGMVLTNYNVGDKVSHRSVTSDTCIVEDIHSDHYNTICEQHHLPSGTIYEPVGKDICDGKYNAMIFIEHNGNGLSSEGVTVGRGSAITICGKESQLTPTGGCIDISADNMTRILSLLDYSKNPHIEITNG